MNQHDRRSYCSRSSPRAAWVGAALFLAAVLTAPGTWAHTPLVDADLSDWCLGAFSNTAPGGGRVEDSFANLVCGRCSTTTSHACQVNSDCPSGQTCTMLTSKTEMVWWDNRTDGAVNDLGTVGFTQDANRLYIAAELWVDPDPVSLPFAEIGIDFMPGGKSTWHDPGGNLTNPGHCSSFTDRACTSDADCHFCAISTEPFPSTRVRTCGSGCDPDNPADVCQTTQTCLDLGSDGPLPNVGVHTSPTTLPDYLVVFDFSRWLLGFTDAALLMKNVGGTWTNVALFLPAVNPGASGGSGGPPGSVELAIPWSAFGCTGCPSCVCPDFGPGQDFRFSLVVARGTTTLDYTPDGAIEDVMSEPVAGQSSTTTNSCPGFGIGNTACELADGSIDSFVPAPPVVPGGRSDGLRLEKNAAPSISLMWNPSCSIADTDYEVYEGEIGNWYSHVPVAGLCSTGGMTSATFNAASGDRYYIVVPTDGSTEGSYGEDSALAERPVSGSACHTQSLGTCP